MVEVALVALASWAGPVSAQPAPPDELRIAAAEVRDGDEVELLVAVPRPTAGLEAVAAALHVREGGELREAVVRPVTGSDLDVVVVLDRAARRETYVIRVIEAAAAEAVLRLPPGSAVTVLPGEGAPSRQAADVVAAISADPPTPLVPVADLLGASLELPRAGGGDHRVVVVISGSVDAAIDAAALGERFSAAGVPVYVAAAATGVEPVPGALEELAAATSGRAVVGDVTELRAAAAAVADEVARQHLVTFRSENDGRAEVEVAIGGTDLRATTVVDTGGPGRTRQVLAIAGPFLAVAGVVAVGLAVATRGWEARTRRGPGADGREATAPVLLGLLGAAALVGAAGAVLALWLLDRIG